MKVVPLSLPGLLLVRPKVHRDSRGFFLESYSEAAYQQHGIACKFVQDNHSASRRDTVRGLHFQTAPGQAKLVRVSSGRIFDVAVDIRPDSASFGRWEGVYLDATDQQQLFVPVGFAHGFCVVSETAEVQYKVSSPYDGDTEAGIRFDDADLGVQWPTQAPLVSARDASAMSFASWRATQAR